MQSGRASAVVRNGPRFAALADVRMQVGPYDEPMSEMELAEQSAKLDALAEKWSRRQQMAEAEAAGQIGWVKAAEETNGRFAMFFLPVGLITEYYTGESVPQQVYTLFQTLGLVEVRHLGVTMRGARPAVPRIIRPDAHACSYCLSPRRIHLHSASHILFSAFLRSKPNGNPRSSCGHGLRREARRHRSLHEGFVFAWPKRPPSLRGSPP